MKSLRLVDHQNGETRQLYGTPRDVLREKCRVRAANCRLYRFRRRWFSPRKIAQLQNTWSTLRIPHYPFTVDTGVQIPLGTPNFLSDINHLALRRYRKKKIHEFYGTPWDGFGGIIASFYAQLPWPRGLRHVSQGSVNTAVSCSDSRAPGPGEWSRCLYPALSSLRQGCASHRRVAP
jgi:hypothetical protein